MAVLATLSGLSGIAKEYTVLEIKSDRHEKEEVGGKKVKLDLINYMHI